MLASGEESTQVESVGGMVCFVGGKHAWLYDIMDCFYSFVVIDVWSEAQKAYKERNNQGHTGQFLTSYSYRDFWNPFSIQA